MTVSRTNPDAGGSDPQGRSLTPAEDLPDQYLDLLKASLTFTLWGAADREMLELSMSRPIVSMVRAVRRVMGIGRPPDRQARATGRDWPRIAVTMVGMDRLDNVRYCVENALQEDVPGDVIEAGVWRGGVTIFMRGILKAYGVSDRAVWVADSFEGLPAPNPKKYPLDRGYDLSVYEGLAASLEEVRGNFERFGLMDKQVRFVKGYFKESLAVAPIGPLAVMRLDADLYESTTDALVHLYPKLSRGGYAIVDDYWNSPPCRAAVDDYRARHGIADEIQRIDWSGAFWRRS